MSRVETRDAAAFEGLYRRYFGLVYRLAYRILSEATAAEDVTQAVFLKIWTAPELFRYGNFDGWIIRVTRNRALDVMRRKSYGQAELPAQHADDIVVEDSVLAALDAQIVHSALAQLAPEQREAIELGFFTGITHEEIAARTGAPLGTVKTRIRTGLRRLRSALDQAVNA